MRLRTTLALTVLALAVLPAIAQTTYTWNNTGTAYEQASNWLPAGGPPTAVDTAQFTVLGTVGTTTAVPTQNNPVLTSAQSAFQAIFGQTADGSGWSLSGTGSLTLGGTNSNGINTTGTATATINGISLAGSSTTNTLGLAIGGGSELALTGTTAVTANQGPIVAAGTLTIDNSGAAANNNTKLLAAGSIVVNGGGVLQFIGNSAGSSLSVGTLLFGSNVVGGRDTIRVVSNGGTGAVLQFANTGAGFTTRPGTRGTTSYETTTGNLGDANGARITFVGTPFLGANGLLSNTSGGGTFGYATVRDGLGTNWATYVAPTPTGGGVISVANPGSGQTVTTVSDAAGLATLTATSIGQFNAPAATVTPTGVVTSGSLRITPAGAGGILATGGNALTTNALMLDGTNDYTITGTASFGGTGTRYIYVNTPTATLSTSIVVANGGNPTTFPGPGFVALTGAGSQNTLTGTNRFVIAGGVVRGNNTQIGFTSAGLGIISLNGGVLEITNGANGTGAAADFTRALGAAAGNVTWGAATANESGPGGFSAFGAAASVNIGGAASPATVTWNTANFVPTGYALRYGSVQSNNTLTWLNPVALDGGTTGPYLSREVSVTRGSGTTADRTVFPAVVSGSASTDLVKTGTGLLELTAANTYAGNTLIRAGVLQATNAVSATGTGSVLVQSGGTLAGGGVLTPTGTLNGVSGATINNLTTFSGGTVLPGVVTAVGASAATTTATPATLTVNAPVLFKGGSTFRVQVTGNVTTASVPTTSGTPGTANSLLSVTGDTSGLTFGTGSVNVLVDLTGANFASGGNQPYSFRIAQAVSGANVIYGGSVSSITFLQNGTDITSQVNGASVQLNGSGVFLTFTPVPVPEPATVLAVAAVGLAGLRAGRRFTASSRRPV